MNWHFVLCRHFEVNADYREEKLVVSISTIPKLFCRFTTSRTKRTKKCKDQEIQLIVYAQGDFQLRKSRFRELFYILYNGFYLK